MYLSQEKAKLMLRRQAGFSIALADKHILKLPKKQDGKRLKVKLADVQRIVDEANKPTPIIVTDDETAIRPFRKSLVKQIRVSAGLPVDL